MTATARKIDRNRHGVRPPAAPASLSIRAVQPLLGYLRARGHDPVAFLRTQGVDPAIFSNPEARLAHATSAALWPAAAQLTNDLDIGLHVAQGIRPTSYGVLGLALRTCATLRGAFERLVRYHHLLHDVAELKLAVSGDRVTLSHALKLTCAAPRAVNEYVVGAWAVTSREATGVRWCPREVRFPHEKPKDISAHLQLFGCPVRFGHLRSEMVFGREILDLPLLEADAELQAILERQVVAVLDKLPRGEAVTDAVRRHLAGELCNGRPEIEQIAPRLNMSPRTLHRRLEEEGTSFREILAEVRRELATRHLAERQLAVSEIAFVLGFSEPSAFNRAFKRWTGQAPLNYRELAQPGAVASAS
jgi:AraC-like DNA-binding protein